MNTLRTPLLALFATASLFASPARADETTYAKILKERDSILTRIVAHREAQFASGVRDNQALLAARLALWSFRRDTSPLKADKIKQQELIVDVFQKKVAEYKTRVAAGVAGDEEGLLATDALLEAQQLLEEIKSETRKL